MSKINSTLDLNELLGIIMTTAAEVVQAKAASLMLLDEGLQELVFKVALGSKGSVLKEKFRVKLGEGIAGWVAQKGESLIINDTKSDKRFAVRFDEATGFQSKAIIGVPMKAKGKIIGVLEAINPLGRDIFSRDDLALFETFADQAAISVENARLHEALVKQELAQRELKIAREIQQSFLPNLNDMTLGIDISCQNAPAREVGGDFYDVVKVHDAKIGIIIGDVSGKGVPASLYMVRAISDSRFLAPRYGDPAAFLGQLNDRLVKDSRFGIFTTLVYLTIDTRENTILYASAGHHPIIRRPSSGKVEVMKGETGIPLGLFKKIDYFVNKVEIAPNDVFVLYTDGVTEAENSTGKDYGIERLEQSLQKECASAQAYSDQIFRNLAEFTRGAEQHDDMTLITLMPCPKR